MIAVNSLDSQAFLAFDKFGQNSLRLIQIVVSILKTRKNLRLNIWHISANTPRSRFLEISENPKAQNNHRQQKNKTSKRGSDCEWHQG
jgi:hypothetical protein